MVFVTIGINTNEQNNFFDRKFAGDLLGAICAIIEIRHNYLDIAIEKNDAQRIEKCRMWYDRAMQLYADINCQLSDIQEK